MISVQTGRVGLFDSCRGLLSTTKDSDLRLILHPRTVEATSTQPSPASKLQPAATLFGSRPAARYSITRRGQVRQGHKDDVATTASSAATVAADPRFLLAIPGAASCLKTNATRGSGSSEKLLARREGASLEERGRQPCGLRADQYRQCARCAATCTVPLAEHPLLNTKQASSLVWEYRCSPSHWPSF